MTESANGDRVTLALRGPLDFPAALRLKYALRDRIDAGCRDIELDLSRVNRAEPCGLAALRRVGGTLLGGGGSFRLVGPADRTSADGDPQRPADPHSQPCAGAQPKPPRAWTVEVTDMLSDPQRTAGLRQQLLHQLPRRRLVVGARALDQGDGARQRGAFAGADAVGEAGEVRCRYQVSAAARSTMRLTSSSST